MMVEQKKLERIVHTIQQQARLLRNAGKILEAAGMERRAAELRAHCSALPAPNFTEFGCHAA